MLQYEPQLLPPDVPRLLPWLTALLLAVLLRDLLLDLNRDPFRDVAVLKQLFNGLDDLGAASVSGPRRGQLGSQFVQPLERLLQPCQPCLRIRAPAFLCCDTRSTDNPRSFALQALRWRSGRPTAPRRRTCRGSVATTPLAQHGDVEGGVLTAGSRQYAEETGCCADADRPCSRSSQLAVGDVEEVATPGQLAEQLPRPLVGTVVGGVAALDVQFCTGTAPLLVTVRM